jgi:hypothetical protein
MSCTKVAETCPALTATPKKYPALPLLNRLMNLMIGLGNPQACTGKTKPTVSKLTSTAFSGKPAIETRQVSPSSLASARATNKELPVPA